MKIPLSLAGGLAGACALTLLHEVLRRKDPEAPRMDLLGMNALARIIHRSGGKTPDEDTLFGITMAGDVVSNALYYSLAGAGEENGVWARGVALGLAAGAGAVYLPGPLGLSKAPSNRTAETKLLTVALYTAGGIVTAAAISFLKKRKLF